MKLIYADYAAATPTDSRVVEAMKLSQIAEFGNPSSVHSFGHAAFTAVDEATQTIAKFLNTTTGEVTYCSCGTESNNLAILGVAKANKDRGRHIITTTIEHPSIINACRALEKDGWKVTYLPVTSGGLVAPDSLKKVLKQDTVLVSIHLANSEIGVVQNVSVLSKIAKEHGAYFHSDACQAGSYLNLDVEKLGVDLLTFNGSKMYGPKGIAVLYVREGVQIFPILYGGGQQNSLRSGTENVPGIVGLAVACTVATTQRQLDYQKVESLRNQLQNDLTDINCQVNAITSPRLPNHLSVIVPTTETNPVSALDRLGVATSAGSACSSRSISQSQVLQAIGLDSDQSNRVLRITLGRQTTTADVAAVALAVKKLISD